MEQGEEKSNPYMKVGRQARKGMDKEEKADRKQNFLGELVDAALDEEIVGVALPGFRYFTSYLT